MTSIEFDPSTRTFVLSTPSTSYAVRLIGGSVRQVHWGRRLSLSQAAEVPTRPAAPDGALVGEELPPEGGLRFGPASLVVEFPGGVRAVEFEYADHEITADGLRIGLVDGAFPLRLDLHYRGYADSDVIARWATLSHTGNRDPIVVERLDSAAWALPHRSDYRLTHVAGEWSAEFTLDRTRLPYGETTATSRRGTTRHQTNPWLAVDPGDATEESGEVWSVALAWSGGFRLTATRDLSGNVAIAGGAGHDPAPARHLMPGERWTTPAALGVYTRDGFGGLSRTFHRYARDHVIPYPDEIRPVLYNTWEATYFDVNEADQRELARTVAPLGIELFVVDDGWFGRRVDDRAGLGDWQPSAAKFPNGIAPLAAEVHDLGMRFGIWVEPEMVNPDSDLYRAHPDWVLHMPQRDRTEIRHQLVLNFARPDVVAWAYGWLHDLVVAGSVDFLKWDMNRPFTEAGWPGAADPGRLWFDHTTGVYDVIDRLRAAHPNLRIESCASGGGRADFAIMSRTDQVWTSDNTDPVDRLPIQDGFGQIYPAVVMGAWVTDSPNPVTGRTTPLRFRFHSAMAGVLGLSGDVRGWSPDERAETVELIAAYKRIRTVVQQGDLHRLATGRLTAVEYVAADRSECVVLAWRPMSRHGATEQPVRLRALDSDATYVDDDGATFSGAVLMAYGLDVSVRMPAGDYASTVVHLRRTSRTDDA